MYESLVLFLSFDHNGPKHQALNKHPPQSEETAVEDWMETNMEKNFRRPQRGLFYKNNEKCNAFILHNSRSTVILSTLASTIQTDSESVWLWLLTDFSCRATKRLILVAFSDCFLNFGSGNHGRQRMNCINFDDTLTLHHMPLYGQSCHHTYRVSTGTFGEQKNMFWKEIIYKPNNNKIYSVVSTWICKQNNPREWALISLWHMKCQ